MRRTWKVKLEVKCIRSSMGHRFTGKPVNWKNWYRQMKTKTISIIDPNWESWNNKPFFLILNNYLENIFPIGRKFSSRKHQERSAFISLMQSLKKWRNCVKLIPYKKLKYLGKKLDQFRRRLIKHLKHLKYLKLLK